MKKLRFISLCLMMIVSLTMVSCKGDKGDPGNANVTSSTVTVNSSDWYWQDPSWRVDLNYGSITPNITDFGAVLVYMNVDGTWRQLPMTYFYSETNNGVVNYYASTLETSTYDGGVSIFWTESDLSNIGAPATHQFKVVVIASAWYYANTGVDYSDYEQVKEFYQIED